METVNQLIEMVLNMGEMSNERVRDTVVIMRQSQIRRSDRDSRVVTEEEVQETVDGLRYEDAKTDQEMRQYIQEIISCITTGDEEQDMESIETFAGTIAAQQNVTK